MFNYWQKLGQFSNTEVDNKEEFFNAWFGKLLYKEDIYLQTRGIGRKYYSKQLGRMVHWTRANFYNLRDGIPDVKIYNTNMFFGVAGRRTKLNGKKYNIGVFPGIYVDVDFKDTSKEEAVETIRSAPFAPSIIVESGNGMHLYFLFKFPFYLRSPDDFLEIDAIIRGVTTAYGGDLKAVDCTRILRIPYTLNRKYDPPLESKVIHVDLNLQYDINDFKPYKEFKVRSKKQVRITRKVDPILNVEPLHFDSLDLPFDIPKSRQDRITFYPEIRGRLDRSARDWRNSEQLLKLGVLPETIVGLGANQDYDFCNKAFERQDTDFYFAHMMHQAKKMARYNLDCEFEGLNEFRNRMVVRCEGCKTQSSLVYENYKDYMKDTYFNRRVLEVEEFEMYMIMVDKNGERKNITINEKAMLKSTSDECKHQGLIDYLYWKKKRTNSKKPCGFENYLRFMKEVFLGKRVVSQTRFSLFFKSIFQWTKSHGRVKFVDMAVCDKSILN